jgi:hypothetical protein
VGLVIALLLVLLLQRRRVRTPAVPGRSGMKIAPIVTGGPPPGPLGETVPSWSEDAEAPGDVPVGPRG